MKIKIDAETIRKLKELSSPEYIAKIVDKTLQEMAKQTVTELDLPFTMYGYEFSDGLTIDVTATPVDDDQARSGDGEREP